MYINNFLEIYHNMNQFKKQINIFRELKNSLIKMIKLQKTGLNFLDYIDILYFRKIEL